MGSPRSATAGAPVHVVALSGGKDSTALALRLREVEPREYRYVCTPTGDELPEMLEHWRRLGEVLGTPLTVLTTGRSLKGEVTRQHHIPNWRQRWCTRMLKIEPFHAYLVGLLAEGHDVTVYVGLRADEPDSVRAGVAYADERIRQRYPLREWGWGLAEVWAYLDQQGVTIPARTDCARCFFQTLPEWWNLWRYYPAIYADAEDDEARTGHTYRSEQRDTWPASLSLLRQEFEKGRVPKGAAQLALMETRPMMCRMCSL